MPESELDSNTRHWLSVHARIRTRIHRLVVLLVLLAAVALVQAFRNLESLNEGYLVAREFTLQVSGAGPRKEIAAAYQHLCTTPKSMCAFGKAYAALQDIPGVNWEFDRFMNKHHPNGPIAFQGFQLDFAAYALLLLVIPIALLLRIYLNVRSLAKIAAALRGKAMDQGEIQQSLNSIFTERATGKLGEYRRSHATVWVLILVVLALASPIFLMSSHTTTRINTTVVIDKSGAMTPLPFAGRGGRTHTQHPDRDLSAILLVLILANLCLGTMVWVSVVRQLRPGDADSAAHASG